MYDLIDLKSFFTDTLAILTILAALIVSTCR